jgi:hypothetical protein
LIDGVDPFAESGQPIGLGCRVYGTPEFCRILSGPRHPDGPSGPPVLF